MNTSITLIRDELLAFLAIIGSKTMNGLEEDPFADLDEQEIAERLNSGEQSLINRDLLKIDEDEVTLDDALVALVGSSVVPDATFLLTRIEPDGSNDVHYFNATSEILMEQTSPKPGIYTFAYLPDAEALLAHIEALLAPLSVLHGQESGDSSPEITLSADAMGRFMEQCKGGGGGGARQTLIQAGLSADVADQLAQDCATNPIWISVVAWNLRDGEPQGLDPVMVFQGESYCWLVENVENDPKLLRILTRLGKQCQKRLMALTTPLTEMN